jgi:hypothetical protein
MSMSQRDTWNMYFAHILQGMLADPTNSRNSEAQAQMKVGQAWGPALGKGNVELVHDALELMDAVWEVVVDKMPFSDEGNSDD